MPERPTHPDREGTARRMEPFVLLELVTGPAYGYELARVIGNLGFQRAGSDPSTVYKLLRSLEEQGFLTSTWSIGDSGPPRRMYELTAAGMTYLHERASDLERQQQRTVQFLSRYREQFPEGSDHG